MPRSAKTAATARSKSSKNVKKTVLSTPEQREQMIAEAAYYLAEQRGFAGGDALEDWLQAEVAVDQSLH